MAARARRCGWCTVSAAAVSRASVPAKAATFSLPSHSIRSRNTDLEVPLHFIDIAEPGDGL